MHCKLIGIPLENGASRKGCEMGPSALRVAGLAEALIELGHDVTDLGNIARPPAPDLDHPNKALRHLGEVAAWTRAVSETAYREAASGMPIFLGGDHAISAGTVAGIARRAGDIGRPLFLLWLDAHSDFHSLDTTQSGNLHGTPVAYVTGRPGFRPYFPDLAVPVDPANVCMIGLRSVDAAERAALRETSVLVHDMRAIDELGSGPVNSF